MPIPPAPKRGIFPEMSPDEQLRADAEYLGQRARWLMHHPHTGCRSAAWNTNMEEHVIETALMAVRYAEAFLLLAESREQMATPARKRRRK